MKNDDNSKKINQLLTTGNKILKILFVLFIILLIYVLTLIVGEWKILSLIGRILSIISPLFFGWFIAWLLNPIVNKLTERGVKRGLSVTFTYLIMLVVVGAILFFTVSSLGSQIADLVSTLPGIASDLTEKINNLFATLSDLSLENLDSIKTAFMGKIQTYLNDLQTGLPSLAMNVVTGFASGMGKILLSLILGFYILFDFDKVSSAFIECFPKKAKGEVTYLLGKINETLYSFVSGTLWLSLLLFIVSVIGFSIIGLNASILIAFVCVVTNLIPYIGPYMGAAVAGILGFAQGPAIGIITLIFIFIVQMLEGNILQPLVMSKKMNLSPITIIISLLIFENLFGILGMIIATPVVALLKIIYVFLDEKFDIFGFADKD